MKAISNSRNKVRLQRKLLVKTQHVPFLQDSTTFEGPFQPRLWVYDCRRPPEKVHLIIFWVNEIIRMFQHFWTVYPFKKHLSLDNSHSKPPHHSKRRCLVDTRNLNPSSKIFQELKLERWHLPELCPSRLLYIEPDRPSYYSLRKSEIQLHLLTPLFNTTFRRLMKSEIRLLPPE